MRREGLPAANDVAQRVPVKHFDDDMHVVWHETPRQQAIALVVEVQYDHVTGGRFRHGTRLVRWRPDKMPKQCTFEQLQREATPSRLMRRIFA